jgi:hypothetical protein
MSRSDLSDLVHTKGIRHGDGLDRVVPTPVVHGVKSGIDFLARC